MLDFWPWFKLDKPTPPYSERRKSGLLRHNKRIKHATPKWIGFKRFWHSLSDHPAMRGQSRRYRRALAKMWYREAQ